MHYRREIDGLRAVAVLPVIFFHAGFPGFSGGFVGVDVFFVISGYLITSILLEDLRNGRFNLLRFYERRIRRILPALYLVMLACLPLAWLLMLPDPLENFGQSLVATTLSANNILLMLTSGYWDLSADFKPLVHTWSLGVEEQFYFVFPVLLLVLWRLGSTKAVVAFAIIGTMSLAAAQFGWVGTTEAGFYLLPTRAWELLVGAGAAFWLSRNPGRPALPMLDMAGLAFIGLAVLLYDERTPFPGLYALLPIAGAAMIILFANPGSMVGRLLGNRIFVGIGLTSYSAYLWHQPLFAFARVYARQEPGAAIFVGLSVLALALAFLSWRYVEIPFRDRRTTGTPLVLSLAATISIAFVGVGYSFHVTHGMPQRLQADVSDYNSGMYIAYNRRAFQYKKAAFDFPEKKNILVVGNSFARDFVNMILENVPTDGVEIVYRDDFGDCFHDDAHQNSALFQTLYTVADVVIIGSGAPTLACVEADIRRVEADDKRLLYAGTKHFGYNLNWLMRVPVQERVLARNTLFQQTIAWNARIHEAVPERNLVDLLSTIQVGEEVLITDEEGRLLSPDTTHLTRFGARYIGSRALSGASFQDVIADD